MSSLNNCLTNNNNQSLNHNRAPTTNHKTNTPNTGMMPATDLNAVVNQLPGMNTQQNAQQNQLTQLFLQLITNLSGNVQGGQSQADTTQLTQLLGTLNALGGNMNPGLPTLDGNVAPNGGQAGPQGEKGEKGDKGDTGAQGAKGEKGDKGDTGAQGEKGAKGDTGAQGAKGDAGASAYQIWRDAGNQGTEQQFLLFLSGKDGQDGVDGKSAYQVWIGAGNKGSEQDFLASLKGDKGDVGAQGAKGDKGDTGAQGAKGDKGDIGAQGVKGDKGDTGAQGAQGAKGDTGAAGQSAYQIWLGMGNQGTEQQFLLSLTGEKGANGQDGINGKSAYQIWIGAGNKGSEQDFLNAIKGEQGVKGDTGAQGAKGDTGAQGVKGDKGDTGAQGAKGDTGAAGQSAYQVWLSAGNQGTENQFLLSLVGDQGAKGQDGIDGKSAYQIWIGAGNKGNEADFLAALKGDQGIKGDTGAQGAKGDKGDTGAQGAQGAKGDTGAQGAKGDKGDTGAQGAKGDTGAQGAQGVQGEQGVKGDTGAQGAKGDKGDGFFEWFSDSVGDFDKDGDIDKADVQAWLKPDTATQPPVTNEKPGAANSQITGEQNRPLAISLFDFDIDLGKVNGLVISDLPKDGVLQFKENGQWKPVEENQEFSLLEMNKGILRFVPDRNESGIDGDPKGVGDGKSDYAQFTYAGTVDGKPVMGESTMSIDIKPAPPVVNQLEGFEDTPLKMSLLDFKLDTRAHDGVQISRLPDDGQLQIVKNGIWVPVQKDEVVSIRTLNDQQIRFIPDPGENGMDGDPEGVGDGKSDYAQFQFVGTINGVQNGTPGTISIDLEPVDTLRGSEDKPLPISLLDLDIDFRKAEGIVINAVPADGTLQVNDNGKWVDLVVNDTVSLRAIDNDQLRFVPDKGESGQDGQPAGIGNGKSTYAQFQYTAVADNEAIDKTRSMNIDIEPYVLTENDKKMMTYVDNQKNKYLLHHGGYKHQGGSDYYVTSGPLKGCTLIHQGGWEFKVFNEGGQELTNYKNPFNGKMASPVALDLNNDGKISTTGVTTAQDRNNGTEIGQTVQFDIDNDGKMDTVEWMTGDGDGLLTDEKGTLFGDEGGKYANGYEKLALRDTNEDGQLTGNELNGLQVWVDDGDAVQEDGEMINAKEMGVSQISVDMELVENARGENLMRSDAIINNQTVLTEDVWFGKDEEEKK